MRFAIPIALSLCTLAARAEPAPLQSRREQDLMVQSWLHRELPRWLELYRGVHKSPELSLQEQKTSDLVARTLREAGYQVTTGVGGFGVVGLMQNGSGSTLLVRGDMDALPIAEETGLSYASKALGRGDDGKEQPVMHACGHDLHLTNLLATAALMAQQRTAWSGTLLIVAEPAEEIGEGSRRMIAAGLFERFPKPDYVLALHVEPDLPAGQVAAVPEWAAANADSVDITIHGRSGHGARPHLAIDPIVAAAYLVTALQTVVSRRNDPQQPAVVTVGSIHGGSKRNVIPDSVQLQLTVRSLTDDVRARSLADVEQIARDVCQTFRCPRAPEVVIKRDYTPAVYNDPALTDTALRVFGQVFGPKAIGQVPAMMGAEDFGRFGKQLHVPSLLFRLGATPAGVFAASKKPGADPPPSLHSSRFAPDAERALSTGVRAMVSLALELLTRAKQRKTELDGGTRPVLKPVIQRDASPDGRP